MANRNYPDYRPGMEVPNRELARIDETAQGALSHTVSADLDGITLATSPSGVQHAPWKAVELWGMIQAADSDPANNRYAWKEAIRLYLGDSWDVTLGTHSGTAASLPFVPLDPKTTLGDGDLVRGYLSESGEFYHALPAEGFWAKLVAKVVTPGQFIKYYYQPVLDLVEPEALHWENGEGFDGGSSEPIPAYEANDIDLPVLAGTSSGASAANRPPPIVWMRSGAGGRYKLFDQPPRWEDVELLSNTPLLIDDIPYYQAKLVRYDQSSKVFCRRRDILVRFATDTIAEDC